MAKILLISQPTIPTSPTMPLNLAYLAAYLERGNHIVNCIDYLAPYNPDDAFRIVEEFKPDIVGFTLRIDSILEKYEFMKRLKKKYPKALYVAGGSHASCAPEEVLRRGKADIVIIGEGEDAFADIANGIKKENIQGCVYLDEENNMKSTGCRKPIEDLDTIPSPAYHHFPLENYTKTNNPNFNRLFWSMFTSRGCPHNCIFCVARNVFDRRYRARSAENVFQEIKLLYEQYGVRHIAFQDDEPLIDKTRIYELCGKLVEYNKKDLTLSVRCRITSIDRDILNKMVEAGFNFVAFGIESGDDESLRKMKKFYTFPQIKKGFEEIGASNLKRINIGILAGFPWENWRNLKNNIRLLKSVPKSVNFNFAVATLIPYPRTELYEKYYEQFGFKEWWLKGSLLKGYESGKTFFGEHAPSLDILCAHNKNFWRFSLKRKLMLFYLAVRLEHVKLRQNYKHPLLTIILALFSYYLHRISLKLEKEIFNVLRPISKRIIIKYGS